MVDHRRRRNRRSRGEEREGGPNDAAGDPVGGEDGRRHDDRVQNLGGGVRVGHRAEQPGGRLDERRERGGEEERLAADREPVSGRDRLRQLPVEELVVEDIGVSVARGLPGVVARSDDEEERQREAAARACAQRVRDLAAFWAAVVGTALMPLVSARSRQAVSEGLSLARGSVGPVRCQARDVSANGMCQGLSLERAVSGPVRFGGCCYAGRTKRPAAAFSPIARSWPFSFTVTWPAAGWASRTSISLPGTRPSS